MSATEQGGSGLRDQPGVGSGAVPGEPIGAETGSGSGEAEAAVLSEEKLKKAGELVEKRWAMRDRKVELLGGVKQLQEALREVLAENERLRVENASLRTTLAELNDKMEATEARLRGLEAEVEELSSTRAGAVEPVEPVAGATERFGGMLEEAREAGGENLTKERVDSIREGWLREPGEGLWQDQSRAEASVRGMVWITDLAMRHPDLKFADLKEQASEYAGAYVDSGDGEVELKLSGVEKEELDSRWQQAGEVVAGVGDEMSQEELFKSLRDEFVEFADDFDSESGEDEKRAWYRRLGVAVKRKLVDTKNRMIIRDSEGKVDKSRIAARVCGVPIGWMIGTAMPWTRLVNSLVGVLTGVTAVKLFRGLAERGHGSAKESWKEAKEATERRKRRLMGAAARSVLAHLADVGAGAGYGLAMEGLAELTGVADNINAGVSSLMEHGQGVAGGVVGAEAVGHQVVSPDVAAGQVGEGVYGVHHGVEEATAGVSQTVGAGEAGSHAAAEAVGQMPGLNLAELAAQKPALADAVQAGGFHLSPGESVLEAVQRLTGHQYGAVVYRPDSPGAKLATGVWHAVVENNPDIVPPELVGRYNDLVAPVLEQGVGYGDLIGNPDLTELATKTGLSVDQLAKAKEVVEAVTGRAEFEGLRRLPSAAGQFIKFR